MSLIANLVNAVLENLTTSLVFLLVFLVLWWYFKPSPYRLPPSPPCFPFFGNTSIYKAATIGDDDEFELYLKYKTPITYRNFFGLHAMLLHKYDLVKEFFSSDKYTDRPHLAIDEFVFRGLVDVSGPRWKEQRRFALSTLRDFGLGKNEIELKIQEEISSELYAAFDEKNGAPFNMNSLMGMAISNIICSMVFGHRFQYDDTTFQKILRLQNENTVYIQWVFLGSFVPFSDWIPGDIFCKKRLINNLDEMKTKIFRPEFKKHMEKYDPEHINDFTDAFIKEMKQREENGDTEHWFTEQQLEWNIEDLFAAGTETTSNTMRWVFLRMLHNPEVQERVRQDIHRVIGKDRLPSMKDRLDLPYIEAVLLECQRKHHVVPYGISHSNLDDNPIEFKGYIFPPSTTTAMNVYTLHNDPEYWHEPEKFNPDRFIREDGKFQKDEHVVTFSVGKRSCLGESLARQELFLFFTGILQRYKITLPPGDPLPSMERVPGVTLSPKPYNVCFVRD
ncbi:unnamed protein product [Owenia fusiformis]|uniref:Cytochrome P450 n=1 Tax=Owenia fusiformis TaxID=6347 RepID=A0A8S4Q3Q8_OWEFU|nr:unnamed protein product [Owenia fusiformis]